MKTVRYLFAIAAFGASTLGAGYAGEPSPSALHQDQATSVHYGERKGDKQTLAASDRAKKGLIKPEIDSHASPRKSPTSPAKAPPNNAAGSKLLPNSGMTSSATVATKSARANSAPPPAWNAAGAVVKAGLATGGSKACKTGPPAPPKVPGGGISAPALGVPHGRMAAVAAIGGRTAGGVKNMEMALNGTSVKRKP